MIEKGRLIRFDWAIKNMLRDKANFDILEGFLSALLREDVQVLEILESESQQETEDQKFNRVDVMIRDSRGRHIIIEIQNETESDYIERLLFGTSKVIVDNLKIGRPYEEIVKVISVSILYFNLGSGDDYVYYGSTQFAGMHTGNPLIIRKRFQTPRGRFVLREKDVEKEIFPEYYMIHVERFEDEIESDLDEWIYMLKNESVREDFKSPNIDKAGEKLAVLKMGEEERRRYERFLMSIPIERDIMETAEAKGHMAGYKKGRKEGHKEGQTSLLRKLLESRFGSLPDWACEELAGADDKTLEIWTMRVMEVRELEDVFK
ncbi:Rpn family recombination-promoting nuclease/putative transposase [Desulfococcaceae bacterium HSG8]|nr:Rpn family recombination-promoting nuclease/putative transposase [Desulfococcaceae bacterium HSG8]